MQDIQNSGQRPLPVKRENSDRIPAVVVFPKVPPKPRGGTKKPLAFFDPKAKLPEWEATSSVWPIKVNQWFTRYHRGVDLGCNYKEPVYAPQGGVVTFSGWNGEYGRTVIISHPGGFQSLVAHNDQLFATVGQKVKQGDIIASCGTTGRSSGPHSHLEFIHESHYLNPLPYIKK